MPRDANTASRGIVRSPIHSLDFAPGRAPVDGVSTPDSVPRRESHGLPRSAPPRGPSIGFEAPVATVEKRDESPPCEVAPAIPRTECPRPPAWHREDHPRNDPRPSMPRSEWRIRTLHTRVTAESGGRCGLTLPHQPIGKLAELARSSLMHGEKKMVSCDCQMAFPVEVTSGNTRASFDRQVHCRVRYPPSSQRLSPLARSHQ